MHHKFDSGELKRKEIRLIRPTDLYDLPDPFKEADERMDVNAIVRGLSTKKQMAAILRKEGFSKAEIAEKLCVTQRRVLQIFQEIRIHFEGL